MSGALLLDTHAVLWWFHQPERLSKPARMAIVEGGNDVFVSPASGFEIASKSRKGLLPFQSPLAHSFDRETQAEGFRELHVTSAHTQLAGSFESAHKDPWDRILAAQAKCEGLKLVTCDRAMPSFDVETLW